MSGAHVRRLLCATPLLRHAPAVARAVGDCPVAASSLRITVAARTASRRPALLVVSRAAHAGTGESKTDAGGQEDGANKPRMPIREFNRQRREVRRTRRLTGGFRTTPVQLQGPRRRLWHMHTAILTAISDGRIDDALQGECRQHDVDG